MDKQGHPDPPSFSMTKGLVTAAQFDATLLRREHFTQLEDRAEQEIRAHIRSMSVGSARHFVVDSSNYFVEHGAVLLAALRLWAVPRQKTDGDLRKLVDSANAATLENIAEEVAENRDPDELHAGVQLEGIAYTTLHASCTTP